MINPVKIIVLLTFLHALLGLPKKTILNRLTFLIISFSLFMEVFNSILIYIGEPISLFTSISIIFYFSLWLYLFKLVNLPYLKKQIYTILSVYILFGFVNAFHFQSNGFSFYTFVVGSLIYIILFLILSFTCLKKEELSFFQNNAFVLLFSPILFFLGLSFMFSFSSKTITSYKIFNEISLYTLVNYSVNFIFYTILNYYIYKERKLENA